MKIFTHFRFYMLKFVAKTVNLSLVFTIKPTFGGVFTNYESFIPTYQKEDNI